MSMPRTASASHQNDQASCCLTPKSEGVAALTFCTRPRHELLVWHNVHLHARSAFSSQGSSLAACKLKQPFIQCRDYVSRSDQCRDLRRLAQPSSIALTAGSTRQCLQHALHPRVLQPKLLSSRVAQGPGTVLAGEQGRPGLGGCAALHRRTPLWGHPVHPILSCATVLAASREVSAAEVMLVL